MCFLKPIYNLLYYHDIFILTPRKKKNRGVQFCKEITQMLTSPGNCYPVLWQLIPFVAVQSLSHVWLFATPWTAVCQGSLSFIISQSLLKFRSLELVISSNNFILCHPLLPLPSIFPSIRVFSNELALHIRWPKYWSFSFGISSPMNIQDWLPLGLTDLISLLSKGLWRVFSTTTIWRHQFFSAQPSLWCNSHIHTWLQEKPELWLYGSLPAKWCLCFLIHCLGLS